eukprot:3637654-Prymnesium_polylepis.1
MPLTRPPRAPLRPQRVGPHQPRLPHVAHLPRAARRGGRPVVAAERATLRILHGHPREFGERRISAPFWTATAPLVTRAPSAAPLPRRPHCVVSS